MPKPMALKPAPSPVSSAASPSPSSASSSSGKKGVTPPFAKGKPVSGMIIPTKVAGLMDQLKVLYST
jgi:hypothetical protein